MVLGGALSVERSRSLRASPLFGSALALVDQITISPTRVDGRHDQHPHKESLVGQRPPAPRARRRIALTRGHPLPSHHTADRIDHLPQLPERKRPLINGQNREPLTRFVATWAANPQGQPLSDQEWWLPLPWSGVQHPSSQRCRLAQRRDWLLTREPLKAWGRVSGRAKIGWCGAGGSPARPDASHEPIHGTATGSIAEQSHSFRRLAQ